MTEITGRWLSSISESGTVSSLINDLSIPDGESVLLLPDMHYPFHPSTGLITNPELVEQVVMHFSETQPNLDLQLGYVDSPYVDKSRALGYLGYNHILEEYDVELVDVSLASRVEKQVKINGSQTKVTVPKPLVECRLFNLPTLRLTADRGMAGGSYNLARFLSTEATPTETDVLSASSILSPIATVLDCFYIYTGTLFKPQLLFAGQDVGYLDKVVIEDFFEIEQGDELYSPSTNTSVTLNGVQYDMIPDNIPVEPISDSKGILQKGYQIYTKLSNDALAPQSMGKD